MRRPVRSSYAHRQSTSGRSPGREMNSKSPNHISSNAANAGLSNQLDLSLSRAAHFLNSSCSVLSINRPLSRKQSRKILASLSCGQCRLVVPTDRCRKDPVPLVLLIGVEPDPALDAVEQPDLLGAVVFVVRLALIGIPGRHRAVRSSGRGCDRKSRCRCHAMVFPCRGRRQRTASPCRLRY